MDSETSTRSVTRLYDDLQREFGQQDWRSSFRAGPDCLGVLGEALLITSRHDMLGIKLTGPNLQYETLFANVSDCAQVGMDTFRKAGERMNRISSLSHDLSKPSGIIERMLQFCNPCQDTRRDRYLQRCMSRAQQTVAQCATEIKDTMTLFEDWNKVTGFLFKALEETIGKKTSEAEEAKSKIIEHSAEKKIKEEALEAEEKRLKSQNEDLAKAKEKTTMYEKVATDSRFSFILSNGRPSINIVDFSLLGAVTAYCQYSSLRSEISRMEDAQTKREREITELTEKSARLQVLLQKLATDSSSIAQLMDLVKGSIRQIAELQGQIKTFMNFLISISNTIDQIVRGSELVFDTVNDVDGLIDPGIRIDFLNDIFMMIGLLKFTSRASQVYTTISTIHIIPTIDNLPKLRLLEAGNDEEVNNRLSELHRLRVDIGDATETLTATMQTDLKKDFQKIAEASAACIQPMIDAVSEAD